MTIRVHDLQLLDNNSSADLVRKYAEMFTAFKSLKIEMLNIFHGLIPVSLYILFHKFSSITHLIQFTRLKHM